MTKARSIPGIIAVLAMLCLCGIARCAAEEIKVPFNFMWGESSERLEDSLAKVSARIVDRKMVGNRRAVVVEGIPQHLLQRAIFYFESDALNEIELHYGDPNWDATQYGDFFDETRRNVDLKYGPGRAVAREKMREGDVLETLIGYEWVQDTTSLELYLYTAERGAESFRLLSLHYRGY